VRESQIELRVVKKAKELGFLSFKFSSPSNRGVPDRVFISSKGDVFFVEFKVKTGKLTQLQQKVQECIESHNVKVFMINEVKIGEAILKQYAS
jgi:hypothetical protein